MGQAAHRAARPCCGVAEIKTPLSSRIFLLHPYGPLTKKPADARQQARDGTELPPLYWRYMRAWVLLGIPAFFAFVIVFYLMVAKPV